MMITFFVPGIPVAKGSGRAFFNKGMKRPIVVQDNAARQKPWASAISYFAQEAGTTILDGPVSLRLLFVMPRPKSHYRTGMNAHLLKPNAPGWHTSTPDLDKLIRCVKDALTNIAWKDDRQVCEMHDLAKIYGDRPGVQITIKGVDE